MWFLRAVPLPKGFGLCVSLKMTLYKSASGLATSSPAATRESGRGGYRRKNCACCCTGFTREGALPTPRVLPKLTQALLQETFFQLFAELSTLMKHIPHPILSKKETNPFPHPVRFFPNCPPSPSRRASAPRCC